jgi:hypothetical protein
MVERAVLGVILRGIVMAGALSLPLFAQTTQPSAAEKVLFQIAQQSGKAADYQSYLKAYPDGVFAEIVRFELEWAVKTSASAAPETPPAPAQTGIGFETLLIAPGTAVDGKSIAALIQGSPLFAPIEGIPDSLWKDQTCSNCHAWTKEAICNQGQTYSTPNGSKAIEKQHPLGGAFKAALKTFALEGCK